MTIAMGEKIFHHQLVYNDYAKLSRNFFNLGSLLEKIFKTTFLSKSGTQEGENTYMGNTGNKEIDVQGIFSSLPNVPTALFQSQCVVWKDEILICGGRPHNHHCYSYHTTKRKYKKICEYPHTIRIFGHVVVKCESDNNELTLLSFGGVDVSKYTLLMSYQSVWEKSRRKEKKKNEWRVVHHDTSFGTRKSNLTGASALIGGKNKDLLFVTYFPNKIDVIDMKTYHYVCGTGSNRLPIKSPYSLQNHCFVPLTSSNQTVVNHFLLIHKNLSLLIKYNEEDKKFCYESLPTCPSLATCDCYGFISFNDQIFFFGGYDASAMTEIDYIFIYAMKDRAWTQSKHSLPIPTRGCCPVLIGDGRFLHLVGGLAHHRTQAMHLATTVRAFDQVCFFFFFLSVIHLVII
ncbi:hypothetical protein RFI_38983 [Reticulomyxa filosa]|uniref:Kelch domain-containing protein n=1 Tax=Reticulomyxa filosa TaxID=46433 RepID=X6L901_RETFI|nr:hypothetical protein RFI_38983 [Reticulomyxa filosa]|eukprot:ETN98507.1 hypothetical protein RFI_38983 [Reticulomyxa filosa]